jgi:hypothetical protein
MLMPEADENVRSIQRRIVVARDAPFVSGELGISYF